MYSKYSQKNANTGFSLIEVIMAVSIFTFLMTTIGAMVWQQYRTTAKVRMYAQMQDFTQILHRRLEKDLSETKRMFNADTVGTGYLQKLDELTPSLVVLPTIRPFGTLAASRTCDKDANVYYWPLSIGNSLFISQVQDTVSDYDDGTIQNRKLDLYSFTLYYPKPYTDITLSGSNGLPILELVKWQSRYYADYTSYKEFMDTLSSSQKTKVLNKLSLLGVEALWDPSAQIPNDAFYPLNATPATAAKLSAGYKIKRLKEINAFLYQPAVSEQITIAYNTNKNASSATYFPTRETIPVFYKSNPTPNAGACGSLAVPASAPTYGGSPAAFPGGFEVGIVGSSSGREVLINTSLVGIGSNVRVEKYDRIVLNAREF